MSSRWLPEVTFCLLSKPFFAGRDLSVSESRVRRLTDSDPVSVHRIFELLRVHRSLPIPGGAVPSAQKKSRALRRAMFIYDFCSRPARLRLRGDSPFDFAQGRLGRLSLHVPVSWRGSSGLLRLFSADRRLCFSVLCPAREWWEWRNRHHPERLHRLRRLPGR